MNNNKIFLERLMCNRRARYKIKAGIASLLRHLFGRYRSRAGCVVLKRELNGNVSVLLIQALNASQKPKSVYKLAAGGIERGESKEIAAARETEEEAGVIGQAAEYLGEHRSRQRMTHTYFHLMDDGFQILPKDKYEEGIAGRERKWFSEDEALKIVPGDQTEFLQKALSIYRAKHNIAGK